MNNGMKHENKDGPVSISLGCQDVSSMKGWMNEHRSFGGKYSKGTGKKW